MIIGALLQATAYTRAQMIVARIVSGVGMGAINSTVPVLQAEFSPKATRGICRSSNAEKIS
jgi:MFS family permease